MKRRSTPQNVDVTTLSRLMAAITDPEDMASFIVDLCSPAELEAWTDRWRVVPLLSEGMSYRAIHEQTGVSITTIGRVARHMATGAGGYELGMRIQNSFNDNDEQNADDEPTNENAE
ncbi:YerC/YecD family TrpR-related protein [Actinomyces vulturis]|uniref:YerC/YecD family TrpR-related protein n=1 Tax=Actinomyces vulturis TaxID=1857645 RepID=UPI0008324F2E|nr:YerC/YecD family TrpR-related protein [Actinomyces vulturis]